MSYVLKINKFSHHFTVTKYTPFVEKVISTFVLNNYVQYTFFKVGGRWKKEPHKVFCTRCTAKAEYRFHINQWSEFVRHFSNNGYSIDKFRIREHKPKEGEYVDIQYTSDKIPKDYQEECLAYMSNESPNMRKMVGLPTGYGKTLTAMLAICDRSRRFVIMVKPKYIEKWISDVIELSNIKFENILVCQGAASLMDVITRGKNNTLNDCKVIIISTRTFMSYIKDYETYGRRILTQGYDCLPQEFMETVRADTRLIDEVHEEFHANFKLDLYTHVYRSISLSATLISEDKFIESMYELAYPRHERFRNVEIEKYVHSHAVHFNIEKASDIRCIIRGNYWHHAVENNIIKNKLKFKHFMGIIEDIFKKQFVDKYTGTERALIYFASIDMCTMATKHFQKLYPKLDIRRYVEDDPYENLMTASVCFSTVGSAGTGHDIAGLTLVILTNAISSSKSNIQGFGRLRKIPNKETHFYYFVCDDLRKNVEYDRQKKELLKDRAATVSDYYTGVTVGRPPMIYK